MNQWTTPTGTTLRPFQVEGIRKVHRDFDMRALWADEVGLGKTLQSLYCATRYLPDDPPGPIVCVVPTHLKINWAREAWKHFGIRVETLYHQRVPLDKQPPSDPNQVYVISYEILAPPLWKVRTSLPADSWAAWLKSLKPRMVIGDEGHYIKEPRSARTRAFKRLCADVPHVLILTGTPLPNKPSDLWSLLNILRPELYPSRFDFNTQFTHMKRYWWGWQSKGARNLDVLHRELSSSCMLRRRKCDVMDQLPAVTYSTIPVEVDLKEYRKVEADFIGWLEKQRPLMVRSAAKAEELNKMNFLKQMVGELKVNAVVQWVNDFLEESDGKLLMGAIHYNVTDPLIKAFGRKAVLVDGRMSDKQKNDCFDTFNHDRKCRLLLGNINAAGTGWSCKSTSDVMLCELPWRPGDVIQFAGRVDGIERGIPGTGAHIRFLVVEDTIEADLCRVLQTKQSWSRMAVDGAGDAGDFSLYDQVRASIRARSQRGVNA